MKTIVIFDQAENAGGSIARAVDLANQLLEFRFVFITYHPLPKLYSATTAGNITAKRVYSFYNYQKKYAHLRLLKSKTKNKLLAYIGIKLIAVADFINEHSVLAQALIKTYSTKIDLVQANAGVHFLPYRLAKAKKAALIYYFRHLDDYRWAVGKMLARANEFIFVGANLMQRHLALLDLPSEKCSLVHSPFDAQGALAKATKSDLQFLYDLKEGGNFIIVQAARICHEKGQHISIDALIKLKDSHPNIALVVAGEVTPDGGAEYQRKLHQKIQENNLEDRVLFIGQRNDILQMLQIADMALQAPLWFEALSGSLIEAMQLGVVTVSADMGGAAEAITHLKTGLLFTAGSSEELAELIAQVIEKKIDTEAIAEAGQEHACEHWNPLGIQQQMRSIYSRALIDFDNKRNNRANNMFRQNFNPQTNRVHIISLSCNPVPPVRYGGIELVIAHLCEGLAALGTKVVCYSPGDFAIDGVAHIQTLATPSTHVKAGGKPNTQEHLASVCSHLQKNLQAGDVVLFNHSDHYRYLKKRLGIFNWLKAHFFEVAHWVDVGMKKNIIYPSQHLATQLARPGVVIPHGEKLLFNTTPGTQERDANLFFAGRITKDKGVDIALAACKKLGIKLILAGPLNDPEFSAPILADESVVYLGELTYEELFEVYRRSKALVYMTQYTEPFGLSVIEAMAAGATVITTGKGGTGETVIEGRTGFFVSTADDIVAAYPKIDTLNEQDCIDRAADYTLESMAKKYFDLITTQ